ncbi:MAG TPA: hypothetical protein ACHBZ9_11845 [Arsenophonus nasoniae]|uniref:hypothetical protein n=1 Tax=Arsenophonus nasoniae TaxID=638 RepID=UPI003879FF78
MADTLYLSGYLDGQEKYYWIITKDKHVHKTISLNLPKVKPQTTDPLDPANELPESQLPSLTVMTEFILAANTTGDAPSYYFYNPQKHELYFQSDDGLSHNQAQLVASNIKSLFPINNKLFSLRDDGAFSLLDNQGKNVLLGVSQEWLRQHHDDAKLELDKLIKAMPYSTDYLMLHGLQDQAGDPIRAWYDSIAGRIVQAGSSVDANHDLVYLGLSEDRQEALIYDNDEQQQYRFLQPAIVTLTPTESGLLISDIPADPLWATFA